MACFIGGGPADVAEDPAVAIKAPYPFGPRDGEEWHLRATTMVRLTAGNVYNTVGMLPTVRDTQVIG